MEDKKENFKKVSNKRKEVIIKYIKSFFNFTNTSFYEFDYNDVEQLFNEIQTTLDEEQTLLYQHLYHKEEKAKKKQSNKR